MASGDSKDFKRIYSIFHRLFGYKGHETYVDFSDKNLNINTELLHKVDGQALIELYQLKPEYPVLAERFHHLGDIEIGGEHLKGMFYELSYMCLLVADYLDLVFEELELHNKIVGDLRSELVNKILSKNPEKSLTEAQAIASKGMLARRYATMEIWDLPGNPLQFLRNKYGFSTKWSDDGKKIKSISEDDISSGILIAADLIFQELQ